MVIGLESATTAVTPTCTCTCIYVYTGSHTGFFGVCVGGESQGPPLYETQCVHDLRSKQYPCMRRKPSNKIYMYIVYMYVSPTVLYIPL